jgi:hypothetical protein
MHTGMNITANMVGKLVVDANAHVVDGRHGGA